MTLFLYLSYSSSSNNNGESLVTVTIQPVSENPRFIKKVFKKLFRKGRIFICSTVVGVFVYVVSPEPCNAIGLNGAMLFKPSIVQQDTRTISPKVALSETRSVSKITYDNISLVDQADRSFLPLNLNDVLEIRAGSDITPFMKVLFKYWLIWAINQNIFPTQGFQSNRVIYPQLGPAMQKPHLYPKVLQQVQDPNIPDGKRCPSNSQNSMGKLSHKLSKEYSQFQDEVFNEGDTNNLLPRFNTNKIQEEQFTELAYDPTRKRFTRDSVDEACAAVQAEIEGKIEKPQRPTVEQAKSTNLDFLVDGPPPFTYFDIKHPASSKILELQGQKTTIQQSAFKLGKSIVAQKSTFINTNSSLGPASAENVGHIVDLCYVPIHEKQIIKEFVLKGAKAAGSTAGIFFINE